MIKDMKIIFLIMTTLSLLCSAQSIAAQKKSGKNRDRKKFPLIISCGVCNQEAVLLPKPEYSKAAQAINASGAVNIEILIDENGNVVSAKAVSGHLLLQSEAIKAALRAKFKPLTISGKPVKVRGTIVYNFVSNHTVETNFFGETVNGRPINLPKPPFPKYFNGKVKKIEIVNVEAEIGENGNVITARAISGHPVLLQASEVAARASKFSLTKVLGVPVRAKVSLRYEFRTSRKWDSEVTFSNLEPIKQ